jgi:hypothetical protein
VSSEPGAGQLVTALLLLEGLRPRLSTARQGLCLLILPVGTPWDWVTYGATEWPTYDPDLGVVDLYHLDEGLQLSLTERNRQPNMKFEVASAVGLSSRS